MLVYLKPSLSQTAKTKILAEILQRLFERLKCYDGVVRFGIQLRCFM